MSRNMMCLTVAVLGLVMLAAAVSAASRVEAWPQPRYKTGPGQLLSRNRDSDTSRPGIGTAPASQNRSAAPVEEFRRSGGTKSRPRQGAWDIPKTRG